MDEIRIVDKSILLYKDKINDATFLHFLCLGVINQFSYVLDKPRILVFDENCVFKKLYKNLTKIGLEVCLSNNKENFANIVHFCEFDFGIVITQKVDVFVINFVSGSGDEISQTKFSIIEKELIKINNFRKNDAKNAKKLKKIKKRTIKYENNNKCSQMQRKIQCDKIKNFNIYFLD